MNGSNRERDCNTQALDERQLWAESDVRHGLKGRADAAESAPVPSAHGIINTPSHRRGSSLHRV